MHATTRLDAAFTATLAAALLALGVTAFSSIEPATTATATATLPAVMVVGNRAALEAELRQPLTAAAQNEGSVARKAS